MINKSSILLSILLIIASYLSAIDDRNNDFQLWTYAIIEKGIGPCLSTRLSVSNRRDKNASRSYYSYGQVELNWKFAPSWILTPGYRQAFKKVNNTKGQLWWKPDFVPLISIQKSWSLWKFTLSDRSRFEYSSISRYWTYRNQIMVKYDSACSPFISNEFFWKKAQRFTQNRMQVGLERPIFGIIEGSMAYMLRSKETSTRWINQHVLVLQIKADF